ncbi:recombinase family protein [Agrobacterium rhizogenes]|uniref:recombinase family protein n=1 Tax=Rhizobium rhizogenes TaxID=359 RepID=UPI001F447F6F
MFTHLDHTSLSTKGPFNLWTERSKETYSVDGFPRASWSVRDRPQNDRFGDSIMAGILGYARVSTGDQDVAGQTIRLKEAGAIKVFTDIKSGKTMDRPGLVELLDYARAGDTLAIVRLDRLGRSLAELLETVKILRERQIDLLSLEEKIDTSSAAGELIFHVFGAIAHFERRLISERTKDGIAAARAKGKLPGRQPLDMKRVEAAIKLIEAKTTPAEAARQLGLGRSTVYREMRRLGINRPT